MILELAKQYNLEQAQQIIAEQGFEPVPVPHTEIELLTPPTGAALHCIDGRYGEDEVGVFSPESSIKDRIIIYRPVTKEGPKFPGGTTGLAAVSSAADIVGINAVAAKLKELGLSSGTHGKCGFAQLLMERRLSALGFVSHELPDFEFFEQNGLTKGKLMRGITRRHGGFHPTLEGLKHQETAIQINPFEGVTTRSETKYFKTDLALPANHFGISPTRSILLTLEVVRALAPHVKRVELIY